MGTAGPRSRWLPRTPKTMCSVAERYQQPVFIDTSKRFSLSFTHVKIVFGSITVKTHNSADVIIEGATGRRAPDTYQGLRRIDIPNEGLEVSE